MKKENKFFYHPTFEFHFEERILYLDTEQISFTEMEAALFVILIEEGIKTGKPISSANLCERYYETNPKDYAVYSGINVTMNCINRMRAKSNKLKDLIKTLPHRGYFININFEDLECTTEKKIELSNDALVNLASAYNDIIQQLIQNIDNGKETQPENLRRQLSSATYKFMSDLKTIS